MEPYRGAFDHGWDAWREEIFARQLSSGVVPEGTVLTPRPPWVQAWDELSDAEKRMYARQQEVFAGFLTHTDAQIGRVLVVARASGTSTTRSSSSSPTTAPAQRAASTAASTNTASLPVWESLEDNIAAYDDWGGPRTYNHYSWAWAWAGNTPLRLWKRYTWLGGTRTPLVVRWPRAIADPGTVRASSPTWSTSCPRSGRGRARGPEGGGRGHPTTY